MDTPWASLGALGSTFYLINGTEDLQSRNRGVARARAADSTSCPTAEVKEWSMFRKGVILAFLAISHKHRRTVSHRFHISLLRSGGVRWKQPYETVASGPRENLKQ